MNTFLFWQRWLLYTSILFSLTGIAYAFFGNSFLFRHYHQLLAMDLFEQDTLPAQANTFREFAAGPIGGTVACAYLLLAYIVYHPFKKQERWAWNTIAVSFTVWFIIDSAICASRGIYFQVIVINGFSYLVKIVPLIVTRKYFI